MSGLSIYVYGSQVLRKRAKAVTEVSPALRRLADDMLKAMYASGGIGLAAPQVGESLRLIVADVSGDEEHRDPRVLFNPVITQARGSVVGEEGCLSVPGVWAEVIRPETITVKGLDIEGTPVEFKDIGGLMARCIQHEADHLEGVLFVDKISATDRILNEPKLKKMSRRAR